MAGIDGLDVTELEPSRYRNPRAALGGSGIKGLDVTEFGERPAARPQMRVNMGGGTAMARAQGIPDVAAAQPAAMAPTAAQPAPGRLASAVRGALPAVAGAAAFGLADRALASDPRGAPVVASSAPGQIPVNPALEFPAPAAVPGSFFRDTETGRNVGNAINATGAASAANAMVRGVSLANSVRQGSNAGRLASAGTTAGQAIAAGNAVEAPNISMPAAAAAVPGKTADPNIGPPQPVPVAPAAPPDIAAAQQGGATPTQQPQQPTPGRSVMDIERAALDIERQNSALRLQADAYGPGVRNADGSGGVAGIGNQRQAEIDRARYERDGGTFLAGSSLRRNATEGRAKIAAADKTLTELGVQSATEAGERGSARNAGVQLQQIEAAERGQDVSARTAANQQAGNNRTQLDIAKLQQQGAKDVAGLNADSRVAAAEARGAATKYTAISLPDTLAPDGLTVMKGGQVLVGADGNVVRPGGAQEAGGKATQPTPRAEYDKMAKGARYVGPDGKTYVKG